MDGVCLLSQGSCLILLIGNPVTSFGQIVIFKNLMLKYTTNNCFRLLELIMFYFLYSLQILQTMYIPVFRTKGLFNTFLRCFYFNFVTFESGITGDFCRELQRFIEKELWKKGVNK